MKTRRLHFIFEDEEKQMLSNSSLGMLGTLGKSLLRAYKVLHGKDMLRMEIHSDELRGIYSVKILMKGYKYSTFAADMIDIRERKKVDKTKHLLLLPLIQLCEDGTHFQLPMGCILHPQAD